LTRWKIDSTSLDEREHDYTAGFTCHNMDTGTEIKFTMTQGKGKDGPVTDIIGGLRALAQLFVKAATSDRPDMPDENTVKLN
jgi:hypothetical protein